MGGTTDQERLEAVSAKLRRFEREYNTRARVAAGLATIAEALDEAITNIIMDGCGGIRCSECLASDDDLFLRCTFLHLQHLFLDLLDDGSDDTDDNDDIIVGS